jgi:hypothetical protein
MQTDEAHRPMTTATRQARTPWLLRWITAALVTLVVLASRKIDGGKGHGYSDAAHYQAMADGKTEMKPFAFRVLTPAAARLFADTTERSTQDGFLVVGLVSLWVLLYGVLRPVIEQPWLVAALTLIPFWLRNLHDYFLPDPLHAALCMVYLALLRRRWWGWAMAMLPVMFLARESTLLLAVIAVPIVWRLAGRRAGLIQAGGAVLGEVASKFAARHAYANLHGINDTLYMIGKIPWNLSKNVFGITLWTNTLPGVQSVKIWSVPQWIHLGSIHQIGYSAFGGTVLLLNAVQLLTSFGLGICVLVCLVWRKPLRELLSQEEPYLCVAAIYGGVTFLLAPVMGASLVRLFDYGWPLFLVYLPVLLSRVWRGCSGWMIAALLSLHLIAAWTEYARMFLFHFSLGTAFAAVVGCDIAGAWLLFRAFSRVRGEKSASTLLC